VLTPAPKGALGGPQASWALSPLTGEVARSLSNPATCQSSDPADGQGLGIFEASRHNWLKKADIEDSALLGVTEKEAAELGETWKRIRPLAQENEVLRRPWAFFARELPPKGSSHWSVPCCRPGSCCGGLAGTGHLQNWAFYAGRARSRSVTGSDAHLIKTAIAHWADSSFRSRFNADELKNLGFGAGANRLARPCGSEQNWSVFTQKCGMTRKVGPPAHMGQVRRNLGATSWNRLWLTDSTEHRTDERKLYCVPSKPSTQTGSWLPHRLPDESVPWLSRSSATRWQSRNRKDPWSIITAVSIPT
jgi:hypothetical protein